MQNRLKIFIKTDNIAKCLLKLNKLNILVSDICYSDKGIEFITTKDDIKKIKKYLPSYKIIFKDSVGFTKIICNIKNNSLFITGLIFSIIIFYFLSHIIVKVNIIHEDQNIRDIIDYSLKMKGVKPLSFKKSYQEYEKIIAEIKEENKDKIEWMEIDVDGMIINIRVEERIIKDYDKEYNTCHIVAKNSGIIRSIWIEKGVSLVNLNSFVKEGDILISGQIKLNDEVKNDVCASGKIYAEVWYNVSVKVPVVEQNVKVLDKMRINLRINDKKLFKSRVKNAKTKSIKLFSFFNLTVYLEKEYATSIVTKTYTNEELENKALKLVHEKLAVKLEDFEEIIDEKVLKKSLNNDNLYMDMFVAVKEQIGVRKYYNKDEGVKDVERDTGNIKRIS